VRRYEDRPGLGVGKGLRPERLRRAEGEGFEPSIRLTTDNGFRDRFEYAGLQGFLSLCASVCASQPALLQRADIER
jgi:hypothetical protein